MLINSHPITEIAHMPTKERTHLNRFLFLMYWTFLPRTSSHLNWLISLTFPMSKFMLPSRHIMTPWKKVWYVFELHFYFPAQHLLEEVSRVVPLLAHLPFIICTTI